MIGPPTVPPPAHALLSVFPMAEPSQAAAPPPSLIVSVLIVTYNCAPALRRCIESVERTQQRESVEILVVDNGSADDCGRIDSEFPGVTVLRLPKNFGLTKARNIGTRTAKGEYLLLLEPDVELLPDTIPALAAHLAADNEAVAVCPLLVSPDFEPVFRTRSLPTTESLAQACRDGGLAGEAAGDLGRATIPIEYPEPGAMLVRRRFIQGMNYFDQHYGQHWSDADLCARIRGSGKTILLMTGTRAVRRAEGLWEPADSDARAALDADLALGAAAYVGKHFGMAAGLRFRLRLILSAVGEALAGLVTFRETGYRFGRLTRILKGQKVDGFQQGL